MPHQLDSSGTISLKSSLVNGFENIDTFSANSITLTDQLRDRLTLSPSPNTVVLQEQNTTNALVMKPMHNSTTPPDETSDMLLAKLCQARDVIAEELQTI